MTDEASVERCSRWIRNIEKGLQMCGDLGDEEIRNIVDDIRCLMQVQVEKNLGAFFKSVEEDYGLRPSIHGDPCRVFSKPLQLSRCSNRADLDDKHLLHLGVPRATVHYFEAVADVSLSTSGHPLQLSEVMCSIADASFDFFRAARRDESICNLLTNKQMKDLHRQDKKLAAEKYRKQLYDATPEGPWCTNYNVLQEHIKSYTTELTVVEEDVQRLQKELALAENKKRLLASKLVSYKNISATADLKQHLLSIVADLRIHILEQKQKRSASRVKLLSKYQEFNGVIVKDILQRRFEVELPDLYSKIMTLLLDSFDNQLDVATVNQSLRLGLEVLRLWRQLTITYANKSLLQRFTAHENALTNKLMQGDKAHSQGSNRTGEFDNCTAFLYFNHIYHDTPDGHMESKRRMDTVVEQIINKSKREIRSHALMEIAKCSVYDVNYSKEASDCSNDKISWNFSSDGNSLHLRNAETDNGNVNFDERLSDVKNNPPEALDAHMSNAHTRAATEASRQLSVIQCTDTVAPPPWILPLVHAPSYLARLNELAADAKKGDWLVPLEFDSDEYELDYLESDSDVEDHPVIISKPEMASPPIILSESSKPVKNRPISPTCFFKEAFALDTKGKALLNAMELYYPPSGVIIAESSKHTVEKKKAATSNRQRVLQKNQRLDLPALEENLPTKRKRQAKIKSDDTYYCSPINKRTKSVAIDSFGEHCEMKDGEKIVSAIYPDTNILAADLNVNVRKQNMAIVQKLIDFGIAKGQICNLISVNALVLQKWLDDSTKDINPGTINRLNDSISIWLSVLSMEDITILKFSRTAQIPSAIVDKLLSTNNFNLKSADVEAVHCDNIRHPLKYNQISFLLKENLQQRAQKLKLLEKSAEFAADVTICHLVQVIMTRERLSPLSLHPIFAIGHNILGLVPTDSIKLLPRWINGDLFGEERNKLVLVLTAWLLSKQRVMSDHEIDYLHRKLAPLSTTSSFCQDAQKLSVLMNNVDISSSALSTDPLVADWLEENSEVPISCPNHKTPNSARNSTEQSDAKIIKCPPSRPIQSSNFIYDSCDEKDEVRLDPEMNQSHRLFVEAKAESQTEKYKADINVEYFGDSLSSNISETRNLNTKTVAKSGSKLSEATILSHERNEITRQQPSLTNSSPKIGVQIDDSISINEQGPHIGYANVSVGRIGVIPQARQLPKESLSRTWLFSAKTDVHFDPANLEHCVSKFCSSINARYCIVGGKTTGSNGKQHYQGYVYRGDKIRFSALCISLKEAFGFLFQVTRVKEDHEKNRQCCSSDREFFEYGYLPKLAVAAELVNAEPTPQKEAQKSSVDDSKQHAPSMLLSDIQDLKQIKIDFHSPPFSTDKYRYDVLKEEKVYKADRMKIDFNYGTCEACHKPGKLICCDSCCCSYHLKCCVPKLSEIPPGDWHCRPCVDTGADQINVVAEEEKNEGLCGKWLLFWNSSAHRWFPGFVLEYSQSLGAFLCEYWINLKQGRQKKQRWLDIARARILYATSGESLLDNLDMKNGREKTLRISDEHITSRQSATLDTHIGADSVKAAYCAAAIACRAVDIVMQNSNANAFCCIRPPGHHAGRYGFTQGCMSTGFCLLNNAAIAMVYSRVKWDLERVAVVDIDVHHGNGTAELLKEDPRAFFACTHMIYGTENCGFRNEAKGAPRYSDGFYPSELGTTEISDNFVSIGIFPKLFETKANYSESDINLLAGPHGFRFALENIILPRLKKFDPELIIISAGFDAYESDPIGGDMGLQIDDFSWATKLLRSVVEDPNGSGKGRLISLMEGGYDTDARSLGLAVCVEHHISALQAK